MKRNIFIALISALTLVLSACSSAPQISVPNVVDLTVSDAQRILTSLEIQVEVEGANEEIPEDSWIIVSQSEEPGKQVSPDTTLTLVAEPAKVDVTVPDLTGLNGSEASDALKQLNLVVVFDAGEDDVWVESNWTVMSSNPPAGTIVPANSMVTLVVSKPDSPTTDTTNTEVTSGGVENYDAQIACENYGNTQYPYGFKPHYILGYIAERLENDQWFLKYEVTITNEYNAKARMVFECTVAGTESSPTVTSFLVY